MSNREMRISALASVIFLSGCCALAPCDRLNHVGGYVRDSSGRPITNAAVTFYGVTHRTDENGCFFFGGVLAAPGFRVEVSAPGFKPYAEGKRFAFYEIDIRLAPEGNSAASTGLWTELAKEQLKSSPSCKETWWKHG